MISWLSLSVSVVDIVRGDDLAAGYVRWSLLMSSHCASQLSSALLFFLRFELIMMFLPKSCSFHANLDKKNRFYYIHFQVYFQI